MRVCDFEKWEYCMRPQQQSNCPRSPGGIAAEPRLSMIGSNPSTGQQRSCSQGPGGNAAEPRLSMAGSNPSSSQGPGDSGRRVLVMGLTIKLSRGPGDSGRRQS